LLSSSGIITPKEIAEEFQVKQAKNHYKMGWTMVRERNNWTSQRRKKSTYL